MFAKKLGLLIVIAVLFAFAAIAETTDYSDPSAWAYYGAEEEMQADVFFIAPTNVMGSPEHLTADLSSEDEENRILWSIGMQTGIYNTRARFFSPYYRQMTMAGYDLPAEERVPYLTVAEEDVMAAFDWYWKNENNGRPFILAGFSQGADMGIRLMKAYAEDEAFQEQLVAAYLIGWHLTEQDVQECPALKPAQGEDDLGVIITFECESEDVTGSIIVPEGVFTYSINPLNWKTDSTPADKTLNLGYVRPAKDGSVKNEIPQLCGGYLDANRGTLKITDVTAEEYPAVLTALPEGAFHIYDYQFFYRNLQNNVETRLEAYLNRE